MMFQQNHPMHVKVSEILLTCYSGYSVQFALLSSAGTFSVSYSGLVDYPLTLNSQCLHDQNYDPSGKWNPQFKIV